MDHDRLFKNLLRTPGVLESFFAAFLPEVAGFVDFSLLEFLDKERFTMDGKRREGDLLIKTRFKGEDAGFLIHLEHQAQPDKELGKRMLEYFILDWREYEVPVYPIAVLSYAETSGIRATPVRIEFPNRTVLHFEFDVIDLGRLDAATHVRMPNPAALALASRMRMERPDRIRLMCDLLVRLADIPGSSRVQEMVVGFFFAYQRLTAREVLQLRRELSKVKPDMAREKAIRLTNPFKELGRREGIRKGLVEGQKREVALVLRLLERRLGSVMPSQEKAIRKLQLSRVEALGEALLEFTSSDDLARWLGENIGK
jgi:hypothetical protein